MSPFLAVLVSGVPAVAEPTPAEPARADVVRLNFPVDSSLMTWVRFFADLRGTNFVIPDPSALEAVKITIVANEDVSPEAAWEAFLSALAVEGYTVGFTGETAKIVAIDAARTGRYGVGEPPDSDAWVTQLFEVRTAGVDEMAALLSDLLGTGTRIVPFPPTDTLIVTGTAANVRVVHQLLRELDVPQPARTVERHPIEFADPEEVRRLIEQVYGDDPRYGIQVFVTPD